MADGKFVKISAKETLLFLVKIFSCHSSKKRFSVIPVLSDSCIPSARGAKTNDQSTISQQKIMGPQSLHNQFPKN